MARPRSALRSSSRRSSWSSRFAWSYARYGALWWIQGAFYGIGAAVIAIIVRSTFKLTKITLGKDPLLWGLFAITAAITAVTESELVWVFLASGAVVVRARSRGPSASGALTILPAFLVSGAHGPLSDRGLGEILWFFTKAGAFVFGSGLAIVPFLYKGVVHEHQWLNEQQFRDAVAVAMITPGPVVITAGFIGFMAGGVAGSLVAAAGTFLPPYLVVVLAARPLQKAKPWLKAFVSGVTASATGAIAGAAYILGRRAIIDVPTALLAAGVLVALVSARRVPEPLWIATAGVIGIVAHHLNH